MIPTYTHNMTFNSIMTLCKHRLDRPHTILNLGSNAKNIKKKVLCQTPNLYLMTNLLCKSFFSQKGNFVFF